MQADDEIRWRREWDSRFDPMLHDLFRDGIGYACGADLPATVPLPGVSLDASLTWALLDEQADERGVIVGEPLLLIAERLVLPHDRSEHHDETGSPWRALVADWFAEPLAELERSRWVTSLGDGLLVRRAA